MYNIIPPAVLGATVLGTQVAAGQVEHPNAVVEAAQATLPLTGAAVGIYLVLAIAFLVAGFFMRHIGRTSAEVE